MINCQINFPKTKLLVKHFYGIFFWSVIYKYTMTYVYDITDLITQLIPVKFLLNI